MIFFDNLPHDISFSWIKIAGVGAAGTNALSYCKNVNKNNFFFETLAVTDAATEIPNFKADWMFMIADINDLTLATQVVERVKDSRTLITSLILCPTAQDARLADIPESFGTWIILPKDKIAATGLTPDELIYQVIDKLTCIVSFNCLIGLDFADVKATLKNRGRACVGFAEENDSLAAVKNALKSPLFIEDIRRAKKSLLVFVGNLESFYMLEANEAATFLERFTPNHGNIFNFIWQVVSDEAANYSSMAFVLATNFKE